MKKRGICVGCLVVALVCVLMFQVPSRAAENDSYQNRYNVVFVTDESGSMDHTDPNRLRYEAIRRFTGLMAQEGNYLGTVSFDDEIRGFQPVGPVEGFAQKNQIVDEVASVDADGDTDIGLGLTAAMDTLDENRDPSLPSVVILLTDGNTYLPDEEAMEHSMAQKADAIERARQAGYQIYTICLNVDGSADVSEMQQIADATGGEFTEVTSATDLGEAETMYYRLIFGAGDSGAEETSFGSDGRAEKEFQVPGVGVEEINIVFEGGLTNCEVTDPNGYVYRDAELDAVSMTGTGFKLVKISNPAGGTWKAVAYGQPGDTIQFRLLYNESFSIETTISPESDYRLGEEVLFHATLYDASGEVTDTAQFSDFTGTIYVTSGSEEKTYPMAVDGTGFTGKFVIEEEGTYYARIIVEDGEIAAESPVIYEISANNSAPIPPEDTPEAHANIWPLIGGTATINLENTAVDPDGNPLTYSIDSSAFKEEDYTLDGSVLKVESFSIPKGSFTIRATDSYGAYCVFDVLVTSTNIGLLMALAILIGGLAVVIVCGVGIYKKKGIPFMGTISVQPFDNTNYGYTAPYTTSPGRGSIALGSFANDTGGLPANCRFQAGGKEKCVYFVSKKPVYSDVTSGAQKKIRIDGSGADIRLYADENMERGIIVTFNSILYNPY